ncbi:MAG: acyl-CoA dehydrogenase family protein [Dehalococcoidales bacterium]|nr:acyl-CoA dehydrogenase family protein [Dehalococcoidales bacterium]
MDFTLSEEHKRLQATVRELANKKFAPVADRLDQKEEFAWDNFRAMAEMGLTGMGIPLEYGGSSGDKLSLALAMEEIARACASTAGILGAHLVLCTEPIYLYGNEQQRRRFLPALARGEKIGAFAITEAEAGSDVSAIKSTATRDGDSYILNGSKVFITNGDVCDVALIFANVPELGKRGMTAFLLEAGMPGFKKGKKYSKLGMRAVTNSELIFENCRVPAANRLGEEGQGMKLCLATLDRGRIGIAAQAIGITQAVLDKATEYAKQRIQFGAPIGQNQAIAWMLADMAAQLEATRLLTHKAASLCDRGEAFGIYASMAKLMASELCMQATTQGIQILGGYGYMMDSPMQRYFRDAKLTTIYEGTSEVQRMVISRSLLR